MKPVKTKEKEEDFGELEELVPRGARYWEVGGGALLLVKASKARGLKVSFKEKKTAVIIYIVKERGKETKRE